MVRNLRISYLLLDLKLWINSVQDQLVGVRVPLESSLKEVCNYK